MTLSLSLSLSRLLATAALAVAIPHSLLAQVPNPVRKVHPTIADPSPTLAPVLGAYASPYFAANDGVWDYGEGFPAAASAADAGGWRNTDDCWSLVDGDVYLKWNWVPWTQFAWTDPFDQNGSSQMPKSMLRTQGYLRPAGLDLPTKHPLYGDVGPYVDQGAFELFKPDAAPPSPSNSKPIVVCVMVRETLAFPKDYAGRSYQWNQTYTGIFSPDGLQRIEKQATIRTVNNFLSNTSTLSGAVDRPRLNLLAQWTPADPYYLIVASVTLSVTGRQTTLNEQRYLQVAQAVKLLLRRTGQENPLYPEAPLTAGEVASNVVVCFVGGSNGGHQAHWATLRHPDLVNGCYCEVISPSLQRLLGEHDLGHAVARLSGAGFSGATVNERDFLQWNQYTWSAGLEMNDMSYPRLALNGGAFRPACFTVGDEDITSTGTDWAGLFNGPGWADHGLMPTTGQFTTGISSFDVGWAVAKNACHQNEVAPMEDPYGSGTQYLSIKLAKNIFARAVAQHLALGPTASPVPPPGTPPGSFLKHTARSANPAQSLYGPDDPQEWALGALGTALPAATSGPLHRDDTFLGGALSGQPHTAGSEPGRREAMLIAGGAVYVGSADGFVSRFVVDTAANLQQLKRTHQSQRLGHEAFALTASGATLFVGTRRHLHRLDLATLAVQQSVEIPWEVAQPHHMVVADVLPSHGAQELVFASVHGGLVFYDPANLTPIYEWTEPGIIDFRAQPGTVTILSARGLVARVTFAWPSGATAPTATLQAVSQTLPDELRQSPGTSDNPCQGLAWDLELMRVHGAGGALSTKTATLWTGDTDNTAVRLHDLATMADEPYLANGGSWSDIATCVEATPPGGDSNSRPGDLLITLGADELKLWGQAGQPMGTLNLHQSPLGNYPFGSGAHTVCVGELVSNPGANYSEEIVVATDTGLMWLHVQDLANGAGPLPAVYNTVVGSAAQPRTNQTLASAWAMARKPNSSGSGFDNFLHVLDQRGAYWKVPYAGPPVLQAAVDVKKSKGWQYFGQITDVDSMHDNGLWFPGNPLNGFYQQNRFRPVDSINVVYERAGGVTNHKSDNWINPPDIDFLVEGFIPFVGLSADSGCVLTLASSKMAFRWRTMGEIPQTPDGWANRIDGFHVTGSLIDGEWSSTDQPAAPDNNCPHLDLRSWTPFLPIMSQQSIHAEIMNNAPGNNIVLVLGRPGGRVGVIQGLVWGPSPLVSLNTGSLKETEDLGYGGSGLAVRHETIPLDKLVIWFGTIAEPAARPQAYSATSSLVASEVAVGAVHRMEWSPTTTSNQGFSNRITKVLRPPAIGGRGGYAVVGLYETDLATWGGRELIVATLSGDLYILDADNLSVERWHTHVDGAIGFYNSILVADLNGDNYLELYVAGSKGVWRFIEQVPFPSP